MSDDPTPADDRRSDRNQEIAHLLATGLTQPQIRERTGASERTIRRLLQDERFRRLVHRARRERTDELNAKIPYLMATGLEELDNLMVNSQSDATRLGAIRTALALGSRLEAEALEDRLALLEDAIGAQAGWTPTYLPDEDLDDGFDG
jgi:transcriptional regulator with XRE-family HTH domain